MNVDSIAKYLYELGVLKRVPRSGWFIAGIKNPESVAEHIFRVAMIGYILALHENADPAKVVMICLTHDLPETRILDLHLLSQRYINKKEEYEKCALEEQVMNLPEELQQSILNWHQEYTNNDSKEGIIAKDADSLEMLLQAQEYKSQGYLVEEWIVNAINNISTPTAKAIADAIIQLPPNSWSPTIK